MRSDGQTFPIVPQNAATAPARSRLTRLSVSKTRSFYDDLYQTQISGCSAFPKSPLQCLPHPYSPLRANTFLRISRNRVQASNPHLNQSFGMRVRCWKLLGVATFSRGTCRIYNHVWYNHVCNCTAVHGNTRILRFEFILRRCWTILWWFPAILRFEKREQTYLFFACTFELYFSETHLLS